MSLRFAYVLIIIKSIIFIMTQGSSLLANALTSTIIRRTLNPFQVLPLSTAHQLLNIRSKKISPVSISASCGMRGTASRSMLSSTSVSLSAHTKNEEVIDSMSYRIRSCNNISQQVQDNLLDFVIDGFVVGKTTNTVAMYLCNNTPGSKPVFEISTKFKPNGKVLTLSEAAGKSLESRSEAVMSVMTNLRSQGVITGWRDELLPLSKRFYDKPLALVERAAAPLLGMQQYGVHINGLMKMPNGEEKMWMARRSTTKSKYPGMLDHIVAGGQPAGLGLMENVLKECMEEAGIPEDVTLKGIQAAGAISYEGFEAFAGSGDLDGVVSRSVLFCYDLELPPDFVPDAVDGEVEEFFQWSIEEVIKSMHRDYYDPIKPNCYPVIIDFLLRRGHISPEIPGYLDVLRELRSGFCG